MTLGPVIWNRYTPRELCRKGYFRLNSLSSSLVRLNSDLNLVVLIWTFDCLLEPIVVIGSSINLMQKRAIKCRHNGDDNTEQHYHRM
jgi:hypothetical protein